MSRELAETGLFPAIDIPRSISRLAPELLSEDKLSLSRAVVSNLSIYRRSRMLIESGMYKAGSDSKIDRAVALKDGLESFLRQSSSERVSRSQSESLLAALMGGAHG